MQTWWICYSDGYACRGVAVVEAESSEDAHRVATLAGCDPGCTAIIQPIPVFVSETEMIAAVPRNVLLTPDELMTKYKISMRNMTLEESDVNAIKRHHAMERARLAWMN